jgi:methylmalonyl-CoA epimerase
MKIKGVHHIGVAVSDLEGSLSRWAALFGVVGGPIEEVPERGVRLAHLRFAEGPEIELVAPLGEESPVARFLESRGEGIQHITLEVDDLAAAMKDLGQAGLRFLSAAPQEGSGGSWVAFAHPKGLNGVLLELRQGPPPGVEKS